MNCNGDDMHQCFFFLYEFTVRVTFYVYLCIKTTIHLYSISQLSFDRILIFVDKTKLYRNKKNPLSSLWTNDIM